MSSERPEAPRRLIDLRIAISGKSGCGNTTVSRLVAARLGLRVVNYTFKDLARDRGMTFEEVCRLAETDPQYDLTIDRMQVQLADQGGCVLGSRLAIWLAERQFEVLGIDTSDIAVGKAREKARKAGVGCHFHVADILKDPSGRRAIRVCLRPGLLSYLGHR